MITINFTYFGDIPPKHYEGATSVLEMFSNSEVDVTIPARGYSAIPLGIGIDSPKNLTLTITNDLSKGTLDRGFIAVQGVAPYNEGNELYCIVHNITDEPVTIAPGSSVCLLHVSVSHTISWVESGDTISETHDMY